MKSDQDPPRTPEDKAPDPAKEIRAALGRLKEIDERSRASGEHPAGLGEDTLERLFSKIAHDIKNPLSSLIMGVDYLSKHLAQQAGDVATVLHEMKRAAQKTRSILRALELYSQLPTPNGLAPPESGDD